MDEHRAPRVDFCDRLTEQFLAYAYDNITDRALPDVRDGLKPVQRRILHAMNELGLAREGANYKKCARIVGDVIGKYHPHGDGAAYDALARMAQDFSLRYPLIEGQGNFGNIDGDSAAAMRYTEARLSPVATLMLQDLERDAVAHADNFSGEEREPTVLPAAFPNLLANGSTGIAVGMATAIPPHNALELCDALLALLDDPQASTAALCAHIKGPDLPTGGVLVESPESMRRTYESGSGGFQVRARWHSEGSDIVVTEIPYQVQKARLVERLARLCADKATPWITDVVDASEREIRIVIPLKRGADHDAVMEALFERSELAVRVPLNNNVLMPDATPRVLALSETLRCFVEHRRDVLERTSAHRLRAIVHRLHILDALLAVHDALDEVVAIIRDHDDPPQALKRRFGLDDEQAQAILAMRLGALRRLEGERLRNERDGLDTERAGLEALLASAERQRTELKKQVTAMRKRLAQSPEHAERRTGLAHLPRVDPQRAQAALNAAARSRNAPPATFTLSPEGVLSRTRGHAGGPGEAGALQALGRDDDIVLLFTGEGRSYAVDANDLPGPRSPGIAVNRLIDLPPGTPVAAMCTSPRIPGAEHRLFIASDDARGFIVEAKQLLTARRAGRQTMNVAQGARLITAARVAPGHTHVATLSDRPRLLGFPLDALPVLGKGRGAQLQRIPAKDRIVRALTLRLDPPAPAWVAARARAGSPTSKPDEVLDALARGNDDP